MKTLILGLGNPILTDDGVGIEIANEIKSLLAKRKPKTDIDIVEASVGGISLLDYITGYERVIIIDSIKTERNIPGTLHKLKLKDLGPAVMHNCWTSHSMGLVDVVELGKNLGYKIPDIINIYGIEIEDDTTFHEGCTPKIQANIPKLAREIMEEEALEQ